MPEFLFTAVDSEGRAHADRVHAPSPSEARTRLETRGLVIRSLDPLDATQSSRTGGFRSAIGTLFSGGAISGISSSAVADFYRNLAILLDAGIGIRQAMSTLADQQRGMSLRLAQRLTDIRDKIADGQSLGEAMAGHLDLFGEMDLRAVEAAERAGVLEDSLKRLASSREATVRLRKRTISAMTYPAMVLFIATAITLLLFTFVVPILIEPIVKSGRSLPLPTRIVKLASDALLYAWWLLIPLLILSVFAAGKLLKTREGRRLFDDFVLRVPVIGPMLRKHGLAQSATLLGTMIRCGINFIQALEVTARAGRNATIRSGLFRWRDEVAAGRDIDEGLIRAGGFPPLMIEMVSVGAASGKLDAMLDKLAETYENDVDETAKRLATLVEPALVLILAGVVLLIALAVLLPILQLGSVFG